MAHVRKLASQNFSKILRVYNDDTEKQQEIISEINLLFCHANVYTERQAYIYMAASVMNSDKVLFEKYMKTNM
jgi:hypothetical protein